MFARAGQEDLKRMDVIGHHIFYKPRPGQELITANFRQLLELPRKHDLQKSYRLLEKIMRENK